MPYLENYNLLKKLYNFEEDFIRVPGTDVIIRNFDFTSPDNEFYPDEEYFSNLALEGGNKTPEREISGISESYLDFITSNPVDYEVNVKFRFPVYCRSNGMKAKKVIMLFHGLNESSWDKYHPWALKLLNDTGCPVILFPIAFHINRRPAEWSDPRKMNAISKERALAYPDVEDTSFVNAAISTRLQYIPELFFWSGYRTFNDVLKLKEEILRGRFDFIESDAETDFFGYSIGAFLTQHLLAIRNDLFPGSKAVLFCGGPTMDLMYPASRYIYDTETEKQMTGFYVDRFDESVREKPYLEKFFNRDVPEAKMFRAMVNFNNLPDYRDKCFSAMRDRILAIALSKDYVIPPESVRRTLYGATIKTGITVVESDSEIDYDHISPFPLSERIKDKTDEFFNRVFKIVGNFFNN